MSTEKKRARSKNFTDCDRVNLLEITADYLNIIENKKTDGVTIRAKNIAWEKICNRFNKIAQTGDRTAIQLKALYDNIKKRCRSELNDKKIDDSLNLNVPSVIQKYQEITARQSIEFTNNHDNLQQFDEIVEEKDPLLTINENSQDSLNDNSCNRNTESVTMPSSTETRDNIENRIENSSTKPNKRKRRNSNVDEKEQLKLDILRIRKEKEEIERDILLLKKRELEIDIEEKLKRFKQL